MAWELSRIRRLWKDEEESAMTNVEKVEILIRDHPEGLDDDEIATLTSIQPRQQIHQICTRLAASGRIRRESVEKPGKRRKIHNFPADTSQPIFPIRPAAQASSNGSPWSVRLHALVAATGRNEVDLLDEALRDLAMKVLKASA